MTNPTYQQLIERTATAALEHFQAQNIRKTLKIELRSMYDAYFAAHGRPEGVFSDDNDAFLPVMQFTEAQFGRVRSAKKAEYNALRRYHSALRALEGFGPAIYKEVA